ncbi:hypothetical protein EG328_004390 [Venturia inaequalis]|uniref:Uncharacterized protein n=1 Tax=Venturia inaequalis TaxID=5025 RepID=A0A8H3V907_VENIN|nr:hypothetical protein EG328_004390 [Venturia inaequalis]KAE9983565.1 hypothetical protein EG327_005445 [Venturia inaequalis]
MRLNQFTVLAILSYCATTIAHQGHVGTADVADTFQHSADSIPDFTASVVEQRDIEKADATIDTTEDAANGKKKHSKRKKIQGRIVDGVEQFEDARHPVKRDGEDEGEVNIDAVAAKGKKKRRKSAKKGRKKGKKSTRVVDGVELFEDVEGLEKRDGEDGGDVNIDAVAAKGKKKRRKSAKKGRKKGKKSSRIVDGVEQLEDAEGLEKRR